MFEFRKERTLLDVTINNALSELNRHSVGSEEYVKALDCVTRLYQLKRDDKASMVSKDTLANIGANLLGIFMIIKHERVNVITSKALNFVIRTRA
jgi:hypothetical protein